MFVTLFQSSNIHPFLVDTQIGLPTVFRMPSSSEDIGTHKKLGNVHGSSARSLQKFLKSTESSESLTFFWKKSCHFGLVVLLVGCVSSSDINVIFKNMPSILPVEFRENPTPPTSKPLGEEA